MSPVSKCPHCRTRFEEPVDPAEFCPNCGVAIDGLAHLVRSLTPARIAKASACAAVGTVPGIVFLVYGNPLPLGLLVAVLGAFVGAAFFLFKLSPTQIASLTVGTVVASNVSVGSRQAVMNAFDRTKSDTPPPPDATTETPEPDSGDDATHA